MAKKAGKVINSPRRKNPVIFGIDDMVDAISKALRTIEVPASAQELTKKAIKTVLQLEQELKLEIVASGDAVHYVGFGKYDSAERSARKGRNPQTGEEIEIPASVVPTFKAGKSLKDAVKENLAPVVEEVVAEEAPVKKTRKAKAQA